MYFVSPFGHAKVYETSVWTPCFQILAKTMIYRNVLLKSSIESFLFNKSATYLERIDAIYMSLCTRLVNSYFLCINFRLILQIINHSSLKVQVLINLEKVEQYPMLTDCPHKFSA